MKGTTTAALLSALVFPGTGQLYLKRTRSGIALLGISLASMYYIIAAAVESILAITTQLQQREIALDANAITELALHAGSGANTPLLILATAIFTLCWVISCIDALRPKQTDDEQ